jgi:hypothetical protein
MSRADVAGELGRLVLRGMMLSTVQAGIPMCKDTKREAAESLPTSVFLFSQRRTVR